MPEIGEVARVVHYLRKHLLSRTITTCTAHDDPIVYGKVGCSASAFESHVKSRVVTNVGQQGKYFYITFDSPPHAVLHLGMTGWVKFSTEDSRYYKQAKERELEAEEWPPTKWVKFLIGVEKEEGAEGREAVEAAFLDPRRLARIRLVDCDASEIRQHSPLKENGPDPVVDKDLFTKEWLAELLGKKRVPVKALMLDQANISGIGNWVADEVLYQARIHPEQYSNTFNDEQIGRLHDAITEVCGLAVRTLADSKQFPETWLMKYRWDKGKKDANVLPNGERIVHLKVGGRTSAIVPSVQKKTAAVAGDVSDADEEATAGKGKKRKANHDDNGDAAEEDRETGKKAGRGAKRGTVKSEDPADSEQKHESATNGTGRKTKKAPATRAKVEDPESEDANGGADEEDEDAQPPEKKAARSKATPKQEKKPAVEGTRRSARTKA